MAAYSVSRKDDSYKNCITGGEDHLLTRLEMSIQKARRIDIIVAFLMESGVKLLLADLKRAVEKGVVLRILCGNYLNITQPQALYLLKDSLGEKVDLRFYNEPNKSFHPKAYIFENDDDKEIYIGSSNVSASALTHGIEWNYRIDSKTSPEDYKHFKTTFEELFDKHSIIVNDAEMRRYSKSWKKPRFLQDMETLEDSVPEKRSRSNAATPVAPYGYPLANQDTDSLKIINYPQPMGAQIEALYELKKSRLDGMDKGIVVAATGVGKTYLAAFDSSGYGSILFVAHREEILRQAEQTFHHVRDDIKIGYFTGEHKDDGCDLLLATVQTLGGEEYLNPSRFARDAFEYIIVDEFHHAVSSSYTKIINYFKPKFLLGLTATPERLDNQDVFAICDYNLVYEVRLKEAINKGWLVPFRYYGIFDETNYNEIDYRNGRYDETQLEAALSIHKRADLILQHYKKYNSNRALGFCSSRHHAVYMAEYLCQHGVKACAVISGNDSSSEYVMNRKDAIVSLKESLIKVIFSVDMFNEGLDVPELDMVLFLRPTESPTIFLQQLGRGLRNHGKKQYVNVLDFIGNYKKANLIPYFLTGDIRDYGKRSGNEGIPDDESYPDDCIVDFDLKIIDLFKRMSQQEMSLFDKIKNEYFRIKEYLSEKPLRLAMYTYMDSDILSGAIRNTSLNPFKDYLSFLSTLGEASEDEKLLLRTEAHEFLKVIEKTGMTKMYKMPILLAFYNQGSIKLSIDDEDIYQSFMEFYSHGSNAVDMLRDKGTSGFRTWGKREYVNLARENPVKYFNKSAPEFFSIDGDKFRLKPSLAEYIKNSAFIRHFKDIIDYRTRRFYRERLEKQQSVYDAEIRENVVEYALRDELSNILAMTNGWMNDDNELMHQIMICKKNPIQKERGLFVLDAKRSGSIFELSDIGRKILNANINNPWKLEYVARIDKQVKVKVSPELFNHLYDAGFFSIWEPVAPLKYFEGCETGYLVVFRAYKLHHPVSEKPLERGRKGRNFIFGLGEEVEVDIDKPVIADDEFKFLENRLMELLRINNWLVLT